MEHIINVLPSLLQGLKYTFIITVVGISIGFVIGAFAGLGRISKNKLIFGISTVYVEVIRGTPILVQIYLFISDCRTY